MGKRTAIIAALVWLIAAGAVVVPFVAKHRRVLASTVTPRAIFGVTPLDIPAHSTACIDNVSFDRQSQVAQFSGLHPGNHPGPALDFIAKGGAYRWVTHLHAGWKDSAPAQIPLIAPRRAVHGTFCIVDRGKTAISVNGTVEPRTVSRSQTYVDGTPAAPDVTLEFVAKDKRRLASRGPEIARHAGVFVPGGAAVVWIAALLAALVIPGGAFAALWWSMRAD